ncbi:MAG: DUF305 domain-containing protein [Bauldia sp.]|nr:DUF305 domain-containing protein [Bauldia sp.]
MPGMGGMPGMGNMPGMDHPAAPAYPPGSHEAALAAANDKMMTDMTIDFTGDPDKDFVLMMIPHHQGAIEMARVELEHGIDPQLRALAEAIIAAQETEIADMRAWLAAAGVAVPTSYEFELVEPAVRGERGIVRFGVRLASGGEGVTAATIEPVDFNATLEGMAHEGILTPLSRSEDGVQRFETVPEMGGRWLAVLRAEVPGAGAPIRGEVIVPIPQ